jgi:hypothetical protein
MPVPTGVSDTYATPIGQTLTVPAPGVLTNDTGGPTSATLVPGSAENGTVSLASDGGFTFTPTPGFIGTGRFRYKPSNLDGEGGETLVVVNIGDCVKWAHLLSGSDGSLSVDGDGRARAEWQVGVDVRNRTASEVLASSKIPQLGQSLRRYKLEAGAYRFDRSYEDEGESNTNLVVVLREARQDRSNPWIWNITITYEGKDEPTAELPEVSTQETEYQDYKTADIYGRVITNSALDPFQGGMPVDDAIDSLVITRNLPYDAWNTDKKRGYRNTLNLFPFRLGNQEDENGDPIDLPPGTVRLKKITEQRLTRSKGRTVAGSKFYWRVTAELVIDQRVFRPRGGADEERVAHRWVVADAGFNTLAAGVRSPIFLAGGQRPTEPQLLNGSGGLLTNPGNAWPASTIPSSAPDVCAATNKAYSYGAGALSVAAPGVLENCYSTTGNTADLTAHLVTNVTSAMGTLTLNSNGSFTFTRNASPLFNGYAWFTYKARAGGVAITDSAPATVVIFCGVSPVMLAFERYPYADWSDLSAILEDW